MKELLQNGQPAPLTDAELAELVAKLSAYPVPTLYLSGDMGHVAIEDESALVIATGAIQSIGILRSLVLAANALPGLLARLAVAEAPKWISVNERLPVDEIDNHDNPFGTTLVLVARPAAPYVSAVALGYRYDGDWFIVRESTEDDFVDNSVTHWQPQPAAPEAGKEPDRA